jgi:trehalose synthase
MEHVDLEEVRVATRDPEAFRALIGDGRTDALIEAGVRIGGLVDGRSIVQVNSTAAGGGVAEMLNVLLPYARFLGLDARWLVIEGDAEFFAITKRLHNHLYGSPGDGGPLGAAEAEHFREIGDANAAELASVTRPDDILVIHDPQPAGLAESAKAHGLPVVWRCHVGVDTPNEHTRLGWEFLRPFLEPYVDEYVFTRAEFAPDWVPRDQLIAIPPSIDPFNTKNQELDDDTGRSILASIGLLAGPSDGPVHYARNDGSTARVDHYADVFRTGPPPAPDAPMVVQVSRWDHMKDMAGVMADFAEWVITDHDAHLTLAGPAVSRVADDPEGALVLEECWRSWLTLPHAARARIQLVCLPMADADENAIMVNALQRHAALIVQKSLAEGFGLTVTEAMFKGRPIIASNLGGIADQIVDQRNGLLVDDPMDAGAFESALARLLDDPDFAARLGATARDDALEHHVGDVHLVRWAEVIDRLINR